jgi:hypothetical protein
MHLISEALSNTWSQHLRITHNGGAPTFSNIENTKQGIILIPHAILNIL